MFSTYRRHLRNRAYLWTHLPVCHGEVTALPISNQATSHWRTPAPTSSYSSPTPWFVKASRKTTGTAVLQQSRVGSTKSVTKQHPLAIRRSVYVPGTVGNITRNVEAPVPACAGGGTACGQAGLCNGNDNRDTRHNPTVCLPPGPARGCGRHLRYGSTGPS